MMESRKRTVHQFGCHSLPNPTSLQLSQKPALSADIQTSQQVSLVSPEHMPSSKQASNIKLLALTCRQTFYKTAASKDTDFSEGQQTPKFALSQRLYLHDQQKMLEIDNSGPRRELEHSQKIRIYRANKLVPECHWLDCLFPDEEDSDSESDLASLWLDNDEDIENTAYLDHQEEFEAASERSQEDYQGPEVSDCSTEAPRLNDIDNKPETPSKGRTAFKIQKT